MKHIWKRRKGQAFTEFILIAAFVGLVLAVASTDLFDGIKRNYYHGVLPLSRGAEVPPPPEGDPSNTSSYQKPVAKISGPTKVHLGETVTFTDESYDVDGKIVSTSWGTKTITRNFAEEGEHLITLTVVDDSGLKNTIDFIVTVGNDAPTPVITIEPDRELHEGETFTISGSKSFDSDGDKIEEWEWYMTGPNGERKRMDWPLSGHTFKENELQMGTYKFELKVTDNYQKSSDFVSKTIEIKEPLNKKPTAVITMNPNSNIDTATTINWSYSNSTDPDGDAIVEAEWKNKASSYPAGTHTVQLRVKDSKGAWSDWVSITFTVAEFIPYEKTFNYTGNYQTFVVPYSGKYKLEVWGAQGGGSYSNGYFYQGVGYGGYSSGEISLNKGDILYIYVGGKGQDAQPNGYGGQGGFNGGGNGGNDFDGDRDDNSGGGGGATDIRLNGTALKDRIIVAGGGGGNGFITGYRRLLDQGYGGGLSGGDSAYTYTVGGNIDGTIPGATQSSGYSLGQGQHGLSSSENHSGGSTGGGGGGYYGGKSYGTYSHGSGGSGYIGGVQNGISIAGNQNMPSPNGSTERGHRGDGFAKIIRIK